MPIIGIANDRRALRPLNRMLPKTCSKICFGCAQIFAWSPLWAHMYRPPRKQTTWQQHPCQDHSKNFIEMYKVRASLQAFYKRNEESFRLHFDLAAFKERYCVDSQPGGNPFRNSTVDVTLNTLRTKGPGSCTQFPLISTSKDCVMYATVPRGTGYGSPG